MSTEKKASRGCFGLLSVSVLHSLKAEASMKEALQESNNGTIIRPLICHSREKRKGEKQIYTRNYTSKFILLIPRSWRPSPVQIEDLFNLKIEYRARIATHCIQKRCNMYWRLKSVLWAKGIVRESSESIERGKAKSEILLRKGQQHAAHLKLCYANLWDADHSFERFLGTVTNIVCLRYTKMFFWSVVFLNYVSSVGN